MFPFLPNELVVKILDTLASSDRKSCLILCLASSWTRRIALPHLLHTVIVTRKNCTAFSEGVVNSQRASYVKRLCIETESGDTGSIITSCTSITALVATTDHIALLSCSPPFQFLTHLCINYFPLTDLGFIIRLFPQLTHFAGIVYSVDELEFLRALLKAYGAQLVMVVAMVLDPWHDSVMALVREMRKKEKNVYIMDYNLFIPERYWEEASGSDSYVWDRARSETRSVLGLDESDDS